LILRTALSSISPPLYPPLFFFVFSCRKPLPRTLSKISLAFAPHPSLPNAASYVLSFKRSSLISASSFSISTRWNRFFTCDSYWVCSVSFSGSSILPVSSSFSFFCNVSFFSSFCFFFFSFFCFFFSFFSFLFSFSFCFFTFFFSFFASFFVFSFFFSFFTSFFFFGETSCIPPFSDSELSESLSAFPFTALVLSTSPDAS